MNKASNARIDDTTPVIRQVALMMLVLCLMVPAALYLRAQRATERLHEPVKTRAAMDALLAAIAPASQPPAAVPDKTTLAALMPQCVDLPGYQGLEFLDDVAEQLGQLDRQLEGLTAIEGQRNAPLRRRYQLQATTWAQGVANGEFGCQQAAQALRLLAGPRGGGLLAHAQWHEQQRGNAAQSPQPAVRLAAGSLAQADPWRGWPGCIWLGGLQPGSTAYHLAPSGRANWSRELCEQPGFRPVNAKTVVAARPAAGNATPTVNDPAWVIPSDLGALTSELDALRLPQGRLYGDYAAALPAHANRATVGRNEVDVGFNLQLTIEPRTQAIAQRIAACYTGQEAACAQASIAFGQVGAAQGAGAASMWERAVTRMTAVAVIDVASGRIEALASAHTPCYAQENDGPFRDAGCLPLWTEPRRRPDALLNHAVFTDYLPGSTIKPLMASVFFEDAGSNTEQLSSWLATSNTDRFNDELFCLGVAKSKGCNRPIRVQQRAADLGWNTDCSMLPSRRCARADILFGRRLSARLAQDGDVTSSLPDATPLQRNALIGRLFVAAPEAGGGERLMPLPEIDPTSAASCRDAKGGWHAANCNSSAMKPLVNEAEGQGQARSTALGVATMLARLTAAANGMQTVRRPHLVEQLTDASGKPVATAATRSDGEISIPLAQAEPTVVAADTAQKVLRGLARGSTPGGTGNLICKHVFGPRCTQAGTLMAGKTGTPSFGFDRFSLTQARQRCRANPRDEGCLQKPVKLYVAAVKSGADGQGRYDKVIAVMSERNWTLASPKLPPAARERVHGGSNDLDNVSTEIAMRIIDAAWWPKAAKP
ncbi:hypothetical protein J2W27_004521 [Variovorax boronicumulans]|uniref:hypothetical protein n=1 Tax=Variovorax boronicumulans TaxID=436515 RepID=UPI0027857C74|nr:hypothetical protein [Variovorax boronicumulans]MDP9912395.1 hypothetical protein [Variovorax boronicumulans]